MLINFINKNIDENALKYPMNSAIILPANVTF